MKKCPKCGSDSIFEGRRSIQGYWLKVYTCEKCGEQWLIEYTKQEQDEFNG